MFTYIDPEVRTKLIREGKLFRIDARGALLDPNASPEALAINLLGPIPLPIRLGGIHATVDWYATVRSSELRAVQDLADDLRERHEQQLFSHLVSSMAVNSVLVVGNARESAEPLVRVHSNCLTGDIFGSQRCECGPQLASAVARMDEDPQGGYLVYMAGHEGRGIGLWAKAATYLLQDGGQDTYQANNSLGLPDDSRDYSDAAALLHFFLEGRPLRLMTNNPKKIQDLTDFGIRGITPVKHVVGVSDWNRRYLNAKRDWGHRLEQDDIDS